MFMFPADLLYGMFHQSALSISHVLDPEYTLLLCLKESNDGSTTDGSENSVQCVEAQST